MSSPDLEQFSRSDLEEIIKVQRDSLDEHRDRLDALEARVEANARQLTTLRAVIAGDEDTFWGLPRDDGEGYDVVGRIEQYEATLDGFAERLGDIQEAEE